MRKRENAALRKFNSYSVGRAGAGAGAGAGPDRGLTSRAGEGRCRGSSRVRVLTAVKVARRKAAA